MIAAFSGSSPEPSALQHQHKSTYTEHKGHESTEDCKQNMAALIAEAAASLKQDEGGDKQGPNGIQQGPMHRWQQAAGCGLTFALCMC